MSKESQLSGNEISWHSTEDNCDYYTTNFGQVQVQCDTEEILFATIGLGRNSGNTPISVRLIDGEFQVTKDLFNTVNAQICSQNYPYKSKTNQVIELIELLKILQKDNNYSTAAVLVKKELIKRVCKEFEFNENESCELYRLLEIWRTPIITRHPVVHRKPIKED